MAGGPRDWMPPENDDRPARSYRSGTTYAPFARTFRNGPGWAALALGTLAIGYAIYVSGNFVIGQGYAASTVGLAAISYGVFALALKRRGDATLTVAPAAGVLFGVAGTLIMGFFVASYYVNSGDRGLPEIAMVAGTDFTKFQDARALDPAAPTQAPDAALTTPRYAEPVQVAPYATPDAERQGLFQRLGTVAFVLGQTHPAAPPETLSISTAGGTLSTPSGQALTIVPIGTAVTYTVAPDRQNYWLTFVGPDFGTRLTYESSTHSVTEG